MITKLDRFGELEFIEKLNDANSKIGGIRGYGITSPLAAGSAGVSALESPPGGWELPPPILTLTGLGFLEMGCPIDEGI